MASVWKTVDRACPAPLPLARMYCVLSAHDAVVQALMLTKSYSYSVRNCEICSDTTAFDVMSHSHAALSGYGPGPSEMDPYFAVVDGVQAQLPLQAMLAVTATAMSRLNMQ